MNTTIPRLLFVCALALAASAVWAASGDAGINYEKRAVSLAVQFLRGASTSDDDFTSFVKAQEIEGTEFLAAFTKAVGVGREIIKQNTSAKNRHFPELLADTVGVSAPVVTTVVKPNLEKPTDAQLAEARTKLMKLGHESFARRGKTLQIYLLRAFGVTLPNDTDNAKWEEFTNYNNGAPPNAIFADFLIRLGASEEKRAHAYAKAKAAEEGKPHAETTGLSFTENKVAAKAGGDKPAEKEVNKDAKLRNAGFSFSQGFGIVTGAGDASVGTLIVRWNALQRRTTLKWNELVNYGARKGGDYAQIDYFGSKGGALLEDQLTSRASVRRVNNLLDFKVLCPTAIGPFLGSGVIGEKVKFGQDSAGNAKMQRPYLLGASLGWGFYDQAGSAFYLDFGYSVSPTSGFKHSRPFLGISLDGLVLGKIIGYVRKPATAPASPE